MRLLTLFVFLTFIGTKQMETGIYTKDFFEIAHFDSIKVDTTIGCFHISYIIKDNDNVIKRQSITSEGDSILLQYADRSVLLNIQQNDRTILYNKEIDKHTFKSIISKNEIDQYQLWFFEIKNVEKEGILFFVNICKPDTDICYPIELYVSKDGDFTITEIEQDEME